MENVTDHEHQIGAPVGQRGPAEHERRVQIIKAAFDHVRLHGYKRTSVAELARGIGVSPAYIYKFFESKRAIGEAICAMSLGEIDAGLWVIARSTRSAEARLGAIYKHLVQEMKSLYFSDHQLLDIVTVSTDENWAAIDHHCQEIEAIIRTIVVDGRESGEFERKTPLDETCQAIAQTMVPFIIPSLIEAEIEQVDDNAGAVARLVLRSLAP
jgi:AcrR family transcriptional regulator